MGTRRSRGDQDRPGETSSDDLKACGDSNARLTFFRLSAACRRALGSKSESFEVSVSVCRPWPMAVGSNFGHRVRRQELDAPLPSYAARARSGPGRFVPHWSEPRRLCWNHRRPAFHGTRVCSCVCVCAHVAQHVKTAQLVRESRQRPRCALISARAEEQQKKVLHTGPLLMNSPHLCQESERRSRRGRRAEVSGDIGTLGGVLAFDRPESRRCGGAVGLRVWREHVGLRPLGPGRAMCRRTSIVVRALERPPCTPEGRIRESARSAPRYGQFAAALAAALDRRASGMGAIRPPRRAGGRARCSHAVRRAHRGRVPIEQALQRGSVKLGRVSSSDFLVQGGGRARPTSGAMVARKSAPGAWSLTMTCATASVSGGG